MSEDKGSFFSRITHSWISPLLKLGSKRPLQYTDFPPLSQSENVHDNALAFDKQWASVTSRTWTSLVRVLWRLHSRKTLFISGIFTFEVLLSLLAPVCIAQLINYTTAENPVLWHGILWAFLLFLSSSLRSLLEQWGYFLADRSGMQVSSQLSAAVYKKSLTLAGVKRGNASNLLNVDPTKVGGIPWRIQRTTRIFLQVTLTTALLYEWLNVSAFVPFAMIFLLGPVNYWMMTNFSRVEDRITKLGDKRIKSLTEVLHGISIVKLFSWENQLSDRVNQLRKTEVSEIKKFNYLLACFMFLLLCVTTFMMLATLSCYSLFGYKLDPEIIFPSLILINGLSWPIMILPDVITHTSEAYVGVKRLSEFFSREEIAPIKRSTQGGSSIEVNEGSFYWPTVPPDPEDDEGEEGEGKEKKDAKETEDSTTKTSSSDRFGFKGFKRCCSSEPVDVELEEVHVATAPLLSGESESDSIALVPAIDKDRFLMRKLNLKIRKGQFCAVIGRVGSGKTALLNSLLGEMKKEVKESSTSEMTDIQVSGSIAYVPQQAWIRNATVKDNILFGRPLVEKRYADVLRECGLEKDIEMLPAGDQTEIGERGVNLSGGQKQRVSLARACYGSSDNYLFDDCLSAVDSHVGRHIFENCFLNALKGKTRVLVTHQLQYLPRVDYIFLVEGGRIQQAGTYDELRSSGFDFASILNHNPATSALASVKLERKRSEEKGKTQEPDSPHKDSDETKESDDDLSAPLLDDSSSTEEKVDLAKKGTLVDEEERTTGAVKWTVYLSYFKATGALWFVAILIFLTVLFELTFQLGQSWLSYWSDHPDDHSVSYYLSIYAACAATGTVCTCIRSFGWAKITLEAGKTMHDRLLYSILRAPMSFFHATPSGRILNRFSKDLYKIDHDLPDNTSDWVLSVIFCLGGIGLITAYLPWFLLPAFPIMLAYVKLQRYYTLSQRELARIKSINESPVFAHFTETLEGLDSIRAFQVQSDLIKENEKLLANSLLTNFVSSAAGSWLSLRLQILGAVIYLGTALFVVFFRDSLSGGKAGLLLSCCAMFGDDLSFFVRIATHLEAQMNAVERITTYTNTESEAPLVVETNRPPRDWPQAGQIEFKNVSLKYRKDQECVLKSLNCVIKAKEKIGIVGRTGAGKTSMTTALFRLTEPCEGKIYIDGVDVMSLGLRDLRSNLGIIPQDPYLFSGTVRSNLDPFNQFSDEQVWTALQRVHMDGYIRSLSKQLDAEVNEKGTNFSLGQRQLLCMGRALLKNTTILILDEATASVDNETDAIIQATVRTEFKNRTVLTIAHRLNTIMDCDRILVLDKGKITEFDSPSALLARPESLFRHLVEEAQRAHGSSSGSRHKSDSSSSSSSSSSSGGSIPPPAG